MDSSATTQEKTPLDIWNENRSRGGAKKCHAGMSAASCTALFELHNNLRSFKSRQQSYKKDTCTLAAAIKNAMYELENLNVPFEDITELLGISAEEC